MVKKEDRVATVVATVAAIMGLLGCLAVPLNTLLSK